MKTMLHIALLALAAAYPSVMIADIIGIPLPSQCDALHALMLFLGVTLSLIMLASYEDKPAERKALHGAKHHQSSLHLLTLHRG